MLAREVVSVPSLEMFKVRWGFEAPALMECVHAHGREVGAK